MLTKVKGTVVKIQGEKPYISDLETFNKQLGLLETGKYQIIIYPAPEKLVSMKKYYFSMESQLARHLGYKKVELHEALKQFIGLGICHQTGNQKYLSISEIDDEAEMLTRILELQEFAAEVCQYVFQDKTSEFKT